jgi:hypothetical protein
MHYRSKANCTSPLLRRLPLKQVVQRLLQIAAGVWPDGASGGAAAADMIDATLAASLAEDRAPVLPVLQQLLCEASPLVATRAAHQLARAPVAWQAVCAVCRVRATPASCWFGQAVLICVCKLRFLCLQGVDIVALPCCNQTLGCALTVEHMRSCT